MIASDMPIGLIVYDQAKDRRGAEAIALRDGPAAGRELEIAELLTWIRDNGISLSTGLVLGFPHEPRDVFDVTGEFLDRANVGGRVFERVKEASPPAPSTPARSALGGDKPDTDDKR